MFITSVLLAGGAFGAGAGGKALVREGASIDGMQGRLSRVEADDAGAYMRFEGDDVWLFELGSDVNDYRSVVKAGTKLQVLPSSRLEGMIADFEEHPGGTYRLWARVTKYKGANYIFADFFLPVAELAPMNFDEPNEPVEPNVAAPVAAGEAAEPNAAQEPAGLNSKPEPNEPGKPSDKPAPSVAAVKKIEMPKLLRDPNAVLVIPQDVLDKLNGKEVILPRKIEPPVKEMPRKLEPRQVVLPKKIKDGAKDEEGTAKDSGPAQDVRDKVKRDSARSNETKITAEGQAASFERPAMRLDAVLADRTAALLKQDKGLPVFVLDALGMSVGQTTLHLLPCDALELTEWQAAEALNRPRFKIAGIKTMYRGKDYLLLQKATRVYGHGNFSN
ncbi:MAG: hypothetical protein JXN61_18425 [Sedimentisphaerales bacterium]|nr:hypothetical protein [Sedimentisphaerales bacterium]